MIVKNDMKKVTLLIPVYNEEAMLPTLYQRLIELVNRNAVYEWEILFVNDGSSDTTLECLRRLSQALAGFGILRHTRYTCIVTISF